MKDKLKSVRVKMDLINDRNSNILFSLHDSKIKKITFRNNILTLHLNKKYILEKFCFMTAI